MAQDMVTDIVKKEKAPLTILVGSFWYEQAELFFQLSWILNNTAFLNLERSFGGQNLSNPFNF